MTNTPTVSEATAPFSLVSFNLASHNDGPQWFLGPEYNVSLHAHRHACVLRELLERAPRKLVAGASAAAPPSDNHAAAAPRRCPIDDGLPTVVCLQESIVSALPGFDCVGEATSHAGPIQLYVPDAARRERLGIELEWVGSAGADSPGGTTYDFPIASLLVPRRRVHATAEGAKEDSAPNAQQRSERVRVVCVSVHMTPFGSQVASRAKQLARVTTAVYTELAARSKAGSAVGVPTLLVVGGDTNMRDGEVAPADLGYADALDLTAARLSCAADALAAAVTWDTATNEYNSYKHRFGRRGSGYTARYDRVLLQRVDAVPVAPTLPELTPPPCDVPTDVHRGPPPAPPSAERDARVAAAAAALTAVAAPAALVRIGDDAYGSPAWDAADADADVAAAENGDELPPAVVPRLTAVAGDATDLRLVCDHVADGTPPPVPRYLSDHYGVAMSLVFV